MAKKSKESASIGKALIGGAMVGAMVGAIAAIVRKRRQVESQTRRPDRPASMDMLSISEDFGSSTAAGGAGGGMSGGGGAGGGMSGGSSAGGGLSG